MKLTTPEIQIIRFNSEDVIATSYAGPLTGTNGLFYIPANNYAGPYSGSGEYVQFSGTFGNIVGSDYRIDNIYNAQAGIDDDKANLDSVQNGGVYLPDVGITIPATVFESIAKQTYDAFTYGDGQYYTNGVSYYTSHWQ